MRTFTGIFSLLLFSVYAFGQGGTDEALIVGTVTDPTGAIVNGANITLVHIATNATTAVRSDERGEYRTPPLRLGEYSIDVDVSGLQALQPARRRSGYRRCPPGGRGAAGGAGFRIRERGSGGSVAANLGFDGRYRDQQQADGGPSPERDGIICSSPRFLRAPSPRARASALEDRQALRWHSCSMDRTTTIRKS